ncbi:addiction module protein [Opitutaceae bacterium]|nr:addiction module protein [Opitutaceae bacterium]MDB4474347.1 addiction module protein [Opitutaceae bacterium]
MDAMTIEQDALNLTTAERAQLVDRLLQTLTPEDADRMERWGREADQRLQAFERGESTAVDGVTAVSKIRQSLG